MKVLAPAPAQAHAHKYATQLLHDEPNARVVAFRLDPGQVVPPHTSPSSVIVHVLEGEGSFSGAADSVLLRPGQSAAYEPGEEHGMVAGSAGLAFLAIITPRP